MTKKDIFHFNHIDKNISQKKMTEIKALYHTHPHNVCVTDVILQ